MKSKLFFVLALYLMVSSTQAQRLTTKVVSANIAEKSVPQLLSTAEQLAGKEMFLQLVADGRWNVLKNHFRNEEDFQNLLLQISYKPEESRAVDNPSIYAHLKPFTLKSSTESKLVLQNNRDKSTLQLNYTLTILPKDFIIENITIEAKNSTLRSSAGKPTDTVPTFARLATYERREYKKPKYYENISNYFLDFKSTPYTEDAAVPFQQINFADFVVQIDYCYDIPILGKQCGRKPYNYKLGPVLSGKDDPDYDPELNPVFENVADITAFANRMTDASGNALPYLRNKNVITCVIADDEGQKITFYREGLEPIDYGLEDGEQSFDNPIAVKEINDVIYVLDIGFNNNPTIYLFKFFHFPDGNYQINKLGKLDLGNLKLFNPSDIGGYKGREATDNHVLLICDLNGIHSLELNTTSGQAALPIAIKTFTELYDENNPTRIYDLKEIKKLDADKNSGYTIALSFQNDIFSFANQQTYRRMGRIAAINHSRPEISDLSNVAYMQTEQKWYVTDYMGGLHTLDKYGRYLGGNLNSGTSEVGGQLYYPNAITPNPIEDPTDPFRYRFIVANKWGRETGFKLFSPLYIITDVSVFENLQDDNLTFTFSTSGKWEAVEYVTAKEFDGLFINGNKINQTQIGNNHSLNDFPNKITMHPNAPELKPFLFRGWNKMSVVINLTKKGVKVPVKQDLYFYWLPQNFVSSGDVFDDFNLDENRYSNMIGQYIYKNINIANRQILVSKKELLLGEYGSLTFLKGASFYNESKYAQGLGNLKFEKDRGSLIFKDSAFICINNTANTIYNPFYKLPDLNENFVLSPKHIKGINASLYPLQNFPTTIASSCKTACEFLVAKEIAVTFNEEITKTSNPYKVTLDIAGTTYSNYIKTIVQKINLNDSILSTAELILKRQSADKYSISDSLASNFTFEPCNKYKIKLIIGCNGEQTNTITWMNHKVFEKLINTAPQVDAGMDNEVCANLSSLKMENFSPAVSGVNSTGTGVWSGEGITPLGVVNFSTLNLSTLPKNVSYTYTFTEYGCSVSESKVVRIFAIPTAPILSYQMPVCKNGQLKLKMENTPGPKVWYEPSGKVFSTIQNPIIEKVQESAQYRATVTLNGCTSSESTINVIVNPLPTVTAGKDTLLCKMSSSIWLTTGRPQGSVAYWYGKGVGNFNFSPSIAGVGVHPLTYVYTDTNGCTNTAVRNITVGPVLTATNESVCANNPAYTLGGVTPTGGTWAGTAVTPAGVFTPASSPIGTQYLTYTATANGCSNSIVKQVTVKPTPAPPYLTAQPRETVCEGSSVTLTPSILIAGTIYKITGPNGFIADRASTTLYNFTESQKGLYTITATKDGCTNSPNANATRTLFFNPLPIVNAGIDEITCTYIPKLLLKNATPVGGSWAGEGYKRDTIMTNTIADNPTGPPPFSSGGAPPPPLIPKIQDVFLPTAKTQGRAYTLTYSYTHPTTGCTNSDTKEIKIGGNPTVTIESSTEDSLCEINTVNHIDLAAIAENSYEYRYQWYKNGNTIAGATSPVLRVTAPARYSVVINASCGGGAADYEVNTGREKYWVKISSGGRHNLAIKADGSLWSWGGNLFGELGNENIYWSDIPIRIGNENNWKEIGTGYYVSAAIKKDGTLWRWGVNAGTFNFGERGDSIPVQVGQDNDWKEISVEESTLLILKNDSSLWGFGDNIFNQLNTTSIPYIDMPINLRPGFQWKSFSTGNGYIAAIKSDGTLWTGGWDFRGNTGRGTNTLNTIDFSQVGNNNDWAKVNCSNNTYAIKENGTLWACGTNENGELGIGDTSIKSSNVLIRVNNDTDWRDIEAYSNTVYCSKQNNSLYSWGSNYAGKGGINNIDIEKIYSPHKINLENISLFSVGKYHAMVTRFCESRLCGVGTNDIGELGNGVSPGYYYSDWTCKSSNMQRLKNKDIVPQYFNSDLFSTPLLGNVTPNPSNNKSKISYRIPPSSSARIVLYGMYKENTLQTFDLPSASGFGDINIDVSDLINGMYIYSLYVNEKLICSKKLIVLK